jgi:plastocyanin
MKHIWNICIAAYLICSCSLKSNATIFIVNVEDNEFGPKNFTINLGDTVKWVLDNSAQMIHTTTSVNIPSGAAAWNREFTQSAPTFMYTPSVPGSYNYRCTFHFQEGMVGQFTVLGSLGITESIFSTTMELKVSNLFSNELELIYSIPKTTELNIRMFNIAGNTISNFVSSSQNAGSHNQKFDLSAASKGIYIITLETQDAILSRKVIIQ